MSLLFIGESAIDALLISLCAAIFEFAAKCFEVFIYLTEIPMVDSSQYTTLVRNVYILVGVVVLFALAFGLLKAMVNPENSGKSTEETGGIVKNLITSIIILIIVPSVFNFALGLQSALINYNTIGKIFGSSSTYSDKTSSSKFIKSQGNTLTNQVFKTFFSPNADYCKSLDLDISTESGYNKCLKEVKVSKAFSWLPFADEEPSLATVYSSVDQNGSFFSYVTFSDSVADGETNFNFLVLLAAGIFLCYVIVSFCFDMGIRLVKLVFYQLIAPIPIMMRVIPDKKMSESFGTWVKICTTCYMEVFIRLLSIYFTCYLCNVIIGNTLGAAKMNVGWGVTLFGKAFIIMGLIAFMKESPKLISEVIGVDSSNMSLGIKDKLAKGGFFTAGAMLGSAATRVSNSAVRSFKKYNALDKKDKTVGKFAKSLIGGAFGAAAAGLGGAGRGYISGRGAKNFTEMKNAASTAVSEYEDKRLKKDNYRARHDGTTSGVIKGKIADTFDSVKSWAGLDTGIKELEEQKAIMDNVQSMRKNIDNVAFDIIDSDMAKNKDTTIYDTARYNMLELRKKKAALDAAKASGDETRIFNAEKDYSSYRKDFAESLSTRTLQGDSNWNSESKELKAELYKLKIATDTYREELGKNITASFITNLGATPADAAAIQSQILDKNVDLSISHVALKDIKDEMKVETTELERKIVELKNEQAKKEGK